MEKHNGNRFGVGLNGADELNLFCPKPIPIFVYGRDGPMQEHRNEFAAHCAAAWKERNDFTIQSGAPTRMRGSGGGGA